MRKCAWFTLLILFFSVGSIHAEYIADYKASDHEAITVSSTAIGVTAEKVKAGGVFITIESANIRFCFDGTVATSTTCHIAYQGDSILLRNKWAALSLSMIQDDATDATARVTYLSE
mgnify:FL=1